MSATNTTGFRILAALSLVHCLNDTLQSVISAGYPILREDLALSFGQIGLITLVYQSSASVFQPLIGHYFDRHPSPRSLLLGTLLSLAGVLSLAFAATFAAVLASVFAVGLGSSVFHPEASRLASLASGGKRGLAQSLFQVGGNLGSSLGPLLAALWIAPYGRRHLADFVLPALVALCVLLPVARWYRGRLRLLRQPPGRTPARAAAPVAPPLSPRRTVLTLAILLLLIFSKYVYTASLSGFYTFYLIEKFGVTVQVSQLLLFVFALSTAVGTLAGGPAGDRLGRKYVIWASILGSAPFALATPQADLTGTVIFTFCAGLMISSAFPAILVYAQELLPYKIGLVSGLFFGFAFGVAGAASAFLGYMADRHGIELVYRLCACMPLLGLVAWFLPDLRHGPSGPDKTPDKTPEKTPGR
ncbi:MAG: MFS transporter [Tannerellaceae bacterium]|jgi:FSR family fosmidomycin resistance protein-like MFS transporter|nr:MFS transporter [Tannerellaceae bacterium]